MEAVTHSAVFFEDLTYTAWLQNMQGKGTVSPEELGDWLQKARSVLRKEEEPQDDGSSDEESEERRLQQAGRDLMRQLGLRGEREVEESKEVELLLILSSRLKPRRRQP